MSPSSAETGQEGDGPTEGSQLQGSEAAWASGGQLLTFHGGCQLRPLPARPHARASQGLLRGPAGLTTKDGPIGGPSTREASPSECHSGTRRPEPPALGTRVPGGSKCAAHLCSPLGPQDHHLVLNGGVAEGTDHPRRLPNLPSWFYALRAGRSRGSWPPPPPAVPPPFTPFPACTAGPLPMQALGSPSSGSTGPRALRGQWVPSGRPGWLSLGRTGVSVPLPWRDSTSSSAPQQITLNF